MYYAALKVGSYFQLKCVTSVQLVSNVVHKFSCSCDANMSYIGMTTRHLGTRIQEHLQSKGKSAIRDHIDDCQFCNQASINNDNFKSNLDVQHGIQHQNSRSSFNKKTQS